VKEGQKSHIESPRWTRLLPLKTTWRNGDGMKQYSKIVWIEGANDEPRIARGFLVKIEDGFVHWQFPDGQTIVLGPQAVVAIKE